MATKAEFVARASVESHGDEEDEDEEASSAPSASAPPSAFAVKTYFDPTAGLTTAQLAALASAVMEADAAGASRRQIKVAALAKRTGLDRSEVLQWLRSVEELMPSSSSSGGGGGGGDDSSRAAARAQWESTLGAYAAAGAAAAARAKAASAARQEERQRRREAADAKRSGGKKGGDGEGNGGDDGDDDGTWSTKKGLGSRGGARLSKAAEATLDRVYARSPYPTDEVVAGVRDLHRELPKKVVLDYFAERRRGDGARGGGGGRGKGSSSAPRGASAPSRASAPARD